MVWNRKGVKAFYKTRIFYSGCEIILGPKPEFKGNTFCCFLWKLISWMFPLEAIRGFQSLLQKCNFCIYKLFCISQRSYKQLTILTLIYLSTSLTHNIWHIDTYTAFCYSLFLLMLYFTWDGILTHSLLEEIY